MKGARQSLRGICKTDSTYRTDSGSTPTTHPHRQGQKYALRTGGSQVVASMWADGIYVCFLFCFYSYFSLVGSNMVGASLAFFPSSPSLLFWNRWLRRVGYILSLPRPTLPLFFFPPSLALLTRACCVWWIRN